MEQFLYLILNIKWFNFAIILMTMKKYSIQIVFLLSFLFCSIVAVQAQLSKIERKDINYRVEQANNLIWHFNFNLRALNYFQDDLILWFENSERKIQDIPVFEFVSFNGEDLNLNIDYNSKNNVFNYEFHLERMSNQILRFDMLCKKLEKLKFSDSKEYKKEVYAIIKTIEAMALELSDMSYDFSRACAINYKKEDYPKQLLKIKNVVSQSKNLIFALRNNNKRQVKDYLNLLDASLYAIHSDLNIMELFVVLKTDLSITEIKLLKQNIYNKAFNISSWGEQYLQSSFSKKGLNDLLQRAIVEFNEAEGKMGCASAFNILLKNSKLDLMLFTEEPNIIHAEIIPEELEIPVYSQTIEKEKEKEMVEEETVIANENFIIESTKEVKKTTNKEVTKEVEVFDEKDINSLEGALTNNLIILMDVSASMKKSGKLPVLKNSIKHILKIMRPEDRISLIAYSGKSKVLISGADKTDKAKINEILANLQSSGGADLQNALDSAYYLGSKNFIKGGNNKIIIASDGVFGVTFSIIKLVKEKTFKGFSLSIFQYNNEDETNNTKSLKYLSEIGNGSLRQISNNEDAISTLMQEIKKSN